LYINIWTEKKDKIGQIKNIIEYAIQQLLFEILRNYKYLNEKYINI